MKPGGTDAKDAEPAAERRYQLKLEGRRVVLTVFKPAANAAAVSRDEVLLACRKHGYANVDSALVETLVTNADGNPSTIGEHDAKPASGEVELSHDSMQAHLRLFPPEPGGRALSADDLRAIVRAAGVVYGVKAEIFDRLATAPEYESDILVAEGRPVEHGEDGWIDYQFDRDRKIHLHADDDSGRVDFKELDLIENVVEGQLLAVRNRPTAGTAGITVKNEYVPPKAGREIALVAGKNVTLSEDGKEAFAASNGMPLVLANKVTVSQVYLIKGSVGPATGNISFLGSVQVADSVEDGFTVKATDSITIGKTVGKAVLEAGQDITVRGGIIESKLVSGGAIRAKFVQEADVEARGDVFVSEAVLHSRVLSGARVIVGIGGKKGTVVGGQIRAYTQVACRVLGSTMSTKTNIDVGINPKLLERMEALQAEIIKDRGNYENLKKGMMALETLKTRLRGNLPADKQKIADTLVLAQNSLMTRLQELATELRELQAQAAVKVQATVCVSEECHPGVKITIGTSVHYVMQGEKFVTYREEAREVRTGTYEAPKVDGGSRRKGRAAQSGAKVEAKAEEIINPFAKKKDS